MNALKDHMFVNLKALALRSDSQEHEIIGLPKKYCEEKMLLELHKLRKVIPQDGRETYGDSGMLSDRTGTCAYISEELRVDSLSENCVI